MLGGLCTSLIVLVLGCGSNGQEPTWSDVERDVRKRWPKVRQISTARLAEMLTTSGNVVLVDVREPREFAISHLPGARSFPEGADLGPLLQDVANSSAIVLYCSVGVRSARAAAALGPTVGPAPVYSLTGSIFAWANEGRPLQGAKGEPAHLVHPFDASWQRLLRPERRAPLD